MGCAVTWHRVGHVVVRRTSGMSGHGPFWAEDMAPRGRLPPTLNADEDIKGCNYPVSRLSSVDLFAEHDSKRVEQANSAEKSWVAKSTMSERLWYTDRSAFSLSCGRLLSQMLHSSLSPFDPQPVQCKPDLCLGPKSDRHSRISTSSIHFSPTSLP